MTDGRREERGTRAEESQSESIEGRLDRLESLVEAQQERIDEQAATIEDQQATIREQRERIADLEGGAGDDGLAVNRRDAMKAGGLLALVFGGSATASADPQGQIGTSGDPLRRLYTEEINGGVTNDKALTNVEGAGLSISSGTLNASGASAWKETDSDGLLEPKGTNTGIEVTDVRTNTLSDNGSGQVTLGGSLDANGNDLSDRSGGRLTLSGNGNGVSVSAGDNLDLGGDDVTNVGTLSGTTVNSTTVNTDSLAPNTSGGSVTLGGPLDANGNTIQDTTGDLSLGATGNVVANATLDAQGGSVTNTTGSLTLSHEDAGNGTSLTLDAGSNDQSLRMTNLPALDNSFLTIDGSGTLGISSESVSSLDSRFVNESGDTMTGNLSMGSSSITDVAGIDGGGSAISVGDRLDAGKPIEFTAGTGALSPPGTDGDTTFDGVAQDQYIGWEMSGSDGALIFAGSQGVGDDGALVLRTQDNGTEEIRLEQHDSSNGNAPRVRLAIDSFGDTDLQGNSLVSVDSVLPSGGILGVDGSIDLAGNNIENVSALIPALTDLIVEGSIDLRGNDLREVRAIRGASSNIRINKSIDLAGNSIRNVASLDNGGNGVDVVDSVNFSNSDNIQDNGTDAIQFDGSQNVTIPNGSLDINGNTLTDSSGDVSLGSSLDVNGNNINNVASIDGGGSAISVDDTLDANGNTITDAGTIDTRDNRNLTLDPGSNNGLTLKNVPSQESDILTLDSNGNVGVSATGSGYTGVRAYRGTDQSLGGASADTDVVVEFDTKAFDTDNNYNTSSFAYTVPSDGFYAVATQVMLVVKADQDRVLKLQKNGSDVPGARARTYERDDGATATLSLTADLQLTSGDSIQVVVRFLNTLDTTTESIRAGSNLTIRRVGS